MNILNLLEAPLPEDWDSEIFSDRVPFKTRVEYAKERAQQVGSGSSRIAFEIPYEGRKTVLKIAKNSKGMAQNEVEVEMLNNARALNANDIVVPEIDHDETSSSPTWIHMEYAPRLKSKQEWKRFTGVNLQDFIYYVIDVRDGRAPGHFDRQGVIDAIDNGGQGEYLADLTDFIISSGMMPNDLSRYSNWGWYNGRPVIIDLGLSPEVFTSYYAPGRNR